MLPDFPKLKKDIHKYFLIRAFENARSSDPLLANIRHYMQHEGHDGTYETMDGYVRPKDYQTFEASYQITADEITSSDFEAILKKFYDMGLDAASKMARYSFEQIGKIIDETGNTINAGGPWTKELFIDMVQKVLIDFDEETGRPKLPSIYIHPSQAESVRKMIQDAESDPEHKKKFDAIIEQKRKEWRDREANRKLVD